MICSYKLMFVFSVCVSLVLSVSFKESQSKKGLDKRMLGGKQKYKVLILGAGMAGINAAKTLYDAGITNFRVLEATNQIDGRLLKKDFHGGAVELGGNWVHGVDNNPIWKLVEEAGLQHGDTMIQPENGKYVVLNEEGEDVTKDDGLEKMEKVESCLEELIKENKKEKVDISVKYGLEKCGWNPTSPAETSIEYFFHDFDAAVPPEKISCGGRLKSNGEIDSTGGRQVLISDKRGYATIIKELAREFGDKIELNNYVKSIKISKDGVTVQIKEGDLFEADFVLVSFSIGVLLENVDTAMFDPALPAVEFTQSLQKLEMGNYLKIFLKFPCRFWTPKVDYIFYASEKRGFYPVWQNYGTPGIPENDNVLLVTVTGQRARDLGNNIDKIRTELMDVLRKVYAKEIAAVENSLGIKAGTLEPLDIEFKNWREDEFFRGAYSNPKPGITSADFDALLKPVHGRMFFAGEGLSELYYGFLQGAYLTGEDQAKKIIAITQYQEGLQKMPKSVNLNYVLRKSIGKPENGTKH